jgi:DNA-binding NarL/FixJ family response regulator
MKKIRIVLADDHRIVREGLSAILGTDSGIEIVGEAENGREAVRLCRDLTPDVLVMDVSMPDMNGLDATRRTASLEAGPRVLALSMHSDVRYVKGMLQAGATGYLLKNTAARELVSAIRAVHAGRFFVSASVGDSVLDDYLRRAAGDAPAPPRALLSTREREVLQLVAEGHTTASIAEVLHLSAKTVENHRARIMDKLGLRSVAELTKYAIREGLTSLDP